MITQLDLTPEQAEVLQLFLDDYARRIVGDDESDEDDDPDKLSDRELEILTLQSSGYSRKQIAKACDISTNTVRIHIFHIYQKLRVFNASHALLVAHKKKIIDIDKLNPPL